MAKPNREQAAKIMRSIRGIGIPASGQLVDSLPDNLVQEIIEADKDNRRSEIPTILANSRPDEPTETSAGDLVGPDEAFPEL